MKQFKKEKAAASAETSGGVHDQHHQLHQHEKNPIDAINSIAARFNTNGSNEAANTLLAVETAIDPNHIGLSSSSQSSLSPTHSLTSKPIVAQLPVLSISPGEMSHAQFKEQLQLHVQTIGILVAEKAELQSKLHQTMKKIDKKQDECDELTGRLKVSRQKIAELEKQVQGFREQMTATGGDLSNTYELRNELASKDLLVDELRVRMSELNRTVELKQDETKRMASLIQELSSQLEMSQIKVQQLCTTSGQSETEASDQIETARDRCRVLEAELAAEIAKAETERREQMQQTQTEAERATRQLESLVDQINRMTDEREQLFEKIDSLESRLVTANQLNTQLKTELDAMHSAVASAAASQTTASTTSGQKSPTGKANDEQYIVKIDLLENEIK